MTIRQRGTVVLCLLLWVGTGALADQAKKSPPRTKATSQTPLDDYQTFSATLNGGIGKDHDRKVYRSGNLMRLDFEDGAYRITDLQRGTTWGVTPRFCTKFGIADAGTFPFSAFRDFKAERVPTTEKETIDGHACIIETITFTPPDGRPFVVKMKLWKAEDLGHFPIKIEVEPSGVGVNKASKLSLTYTNVNLDKPDPALFKHPVKCTGAPPPRSAGAGQKDHSVPQQSPATRQ